LGDTKTLHAPLYTIIPGNWRHHAHGIINQENYISHSDTNEVHKQNVPSLCERTLSKGIDKRKMTGKSKGNILDIGSGTGAFLLSCN